MIEHIFERWMFWDPWLGCKVFLVNSWYTLCAAHFLSIRAELDLWAFNMPIFIDKYEGKIRNLFIAVVLYHGKIVNSAYFAVIELYKVDNFLKK